MKVIAAALLLALVVGCAAPLSSMFWPSPSADIVKMDESECAIKQLRFCISEVRLYLKWKMNILKELTHGSLGFPASNDPL